MSVIVRGPDDKIQLFCKGADSVIYERLAPADKEYAGVLLQELESFATEGLRTLVCAYANLKEEEYLEWKNMYHKACCAMQNREGLLRASIVIRNGCKNIICNSIVTVNFTKQQFYIKNLTTYSLLS